MTKLKKNSPRGISRLIRGPTRPKREIAMTYLSLSVRRTKKETLLLTITNLGGSDEERMCISFGKKVVKAWCRVRSSTCSGPTTTSTRLKLVLATTTLRSTVNHHCDQPEDSCSRGIQGCACETLGREW